jgi:hypothetical protein
MEESLETPVTLATGHNNTVVGVYTDRVEVRTGWQGQNIESVGLRDIATVRVKGLVNVTLGIQTNKGRVYEINRMALPDARRVKSAIESSKQRAGLYE